MDWSMEVDEEQEIITITLEGEWEAAGVPEVLKSLWAALLRTGILRALWDFRGIKVGDVSTSEIRTVATLHLGDRPELPRTRAAVVVSGDLEFGMARMAEAFITGSPADMQVFRNLTEATEWLMAGD